MVPSADEKQSRHKPRHSNSNAVHEPFLDSLLKGRRLHPEFSFLRKWGVYYDIASDQRVASILERLYRLWPQLSAKDRHLYLWTAESIAEAEGAKHTWNPKASRDRYCNG
jgi:hypothetical protein